MTDRDVMKMLIKLFEAEAKRLSLLEKDRKICKECAEKLNQHFFGKKTASYSADAKKKVINLSVAAIQESCMSDSLKQKLLLDVNEVRKKAGLDEDEILMEIINDTLFGRFASDIAPSFSKFC